ncbi:MAG: hypothetical protein RL154_1722, partial [Pseudomonadota bacterium]
KEIRTFKHYDELPIIAMTAAASPSDKANCLNAGMNDFVSKPIVIDELVSALCIYVDKGSAVAKIEVVQEPIEIQNEIILDGIDTTILHSFFEGNEAEDYLRKFAKNSSNIVEDITNNLANGDKKAACVIAHTMKSNAGYLGAKKLTEYARELENELKNDLEIVNFEPFKAEFTKVINSINKSYPQEVAVDAKEPTESEAKIALDLLEDIKSKLLKHKFVDKAEIVSFKECVMPFAPTELANSAFSNIDGFKNSEALANVLELIEYFGKF